jgi:hypothetical protein
MGSRRGIMKLRLFLRVVIVLLVLGLVAAIFLPMLFRAKESGPRHSCLSNLKQLGLGLKQYAQDFGEKYPWQAGRTDPHDAWRDLGLMYPNYLTAIGVYLCPSSKDRKFDPMCDLGAKEDYPFEPFRDNPKERISYGYCFDARDPVRPTSWSERTSPDTRLMADKKAGVRIKEGTNNPPSKVAQHSVKRFLRRRRYGRHVLYQDGHVQLEMSEEALDPNPADDAVGVPGANKYTAWWSDPPFYGE